MQNHSIRTNLLICSCFLCLLTIFSISINGQSGVAEELVACQNLMLEGKFELIIDKTNELQNLDNLTNADQIAIYEIQSRAYYSRGAKFKEKSFECLRKMCELGPCVLPLPRETWPARLKQEWYSASEKVGALTCTEDTSETKLQTIAIWDFENNSGKKYQEELGNFGATLADMFAADFKKVSSLNIVERDKIQYLINEHKLAEDNLVDQSTAIKAGRLLSVHIMVFGSFTQLTDKETAMTLRAVNVETGELMASAQMIGKPKYFEIQKLLVKELCQELNIALSGDDKKMIELGGTESLDATKAYAIGLQYEAQHNYEKAYDYFKQAYDLDNEFTEAIFKMDVYRFLS